MPKKITIEHRNLKDCHEKMQANTDGPRGIARGIKEITQGLHRLQEYDAVTAAHMMSQIDDIPLAFMEYVGLRSDCLSVKSGIPLGFVRKYQYLVAAIVFLLQQVKISHNMVHVPTLEEILKGMDSEWMWLDFEVTYRYCDFNDQSFIIDRTPSNLQKFRN